MRLGFVEVGVGVGVRNPYLLWQGDPVQDDGLHVRHPSMVLRVRVRVRVGLRVRVRVSWGWGWDLKSIPAVARRTSLDGSQAQG